MSTGCLNNFNISLCRVDNKWPKTKIYYKNKICCKTKAFIQQLCAAWGLMQPEELKTGIYVLAIFSDERNARRILQSMVEILCS